MHWKYVVLWEQYDAEIWFWCSMPCITFNTHNINLQESRNLKNDTCAHYILIFFPKTAQELDFP